MSETRDEVTRASEPEGQELLRLFPEVESCTCKLAEGGNRVGCDEVYPPGLSPTLW